MLPPGVSAAVQLANTDIAVGTAGLPTTVWTITVFGNATATFILRNGTDTSGTALWGPETAGATTGARHYKFPNGMFFPSGCFYDVTAATPSVTITYTQRRA